jgi:predicted NAD/FAD-dependent oxidoreductase
MAPPWPPSSANTESPKTIENLNTAENLYPTKSKIVFAGDYTVNGSIDGALQSGLTAAVKILRNRL